MILPDATDLVRSLVSRLCPACGNRKNARMTFCGSCYRRLPPHRKHALYGRLGEGYEEAVSAAMDYFGHTEFHLPPAPELGSGLDNLPPGQKSSWFQWCSAAGLDPKASPKPELAWRAYVAGWTGGEFKKGKSKKKGQDFTDITSDMEL